MPNRRLFLACLLFGGVALSDVGADAAQRVVSGLDKKAEAFLVEMSPQWLTDLTSRF